MKKLIRCLFIVCILCFSISPVYARAGGGGGGSSGGGGGGSGSPSHHSSSPVRYVDTPERRIASLITFSFISYGFSYMKKYRRRYKAISMHKDMKRGLAEKNNSSFDEKKMNKVVADYYYTIQNEIWIFLNNAFLSLYMTNGKQNLTGGSMKVYVMNFLISDFLKQWL